MRYSGRIFFDPSDGYLMIIKEDMVRSWLFAETGELVKGLGWIFAHYNPLPGHQDVTLDILFRGLYEEAMYQR
jgi:hypothetical protein